MTLTIPELRDYQRQAVAEIRVAYRDHRGVLFVLSTGGGKTVTFAYIAHSAAAKGKRILVLAHRKELIEQASATFGAFGIEHGVIMTGRTGNRLPVQIGMVATVRNRLDRIAAPDLIIVDEAHHTTANTYRTIIDAFPSARLLGVTATPQRTDGSGLGDIFGAMVEGPSMADLTDRGSLSRFRLFIPAQQIQVAGVKIKGGEFDRKEAAAAADRSVITGDAVEHYRRLCNGKQAVAFCCSVEHAEHVAEAFRGAGIVSSRIDGSMKPAERSDILAAYEARQIQVLTSADLISEGFDVPAIEAAILLRPTQSVIVYLQQVGRALRPAPGKAHAIILDHAGNCQRHGFPDDPREWSLEGREKGSRVVVGGFPVTTCMDCFAAYRPSLDRCPHCGGLKEVRGRTIEYRDGELVEITAAMEREGELKTLPFREAIASLKSVEDIKLMASAKGYKPGWAIRQAMGRFGMTPLSAASALGYAPGIVWKLNLDSYRPRPADVYLEPAT